MKQGIKRKVSEDDGSSKSSGLKRKKIDSSKKISALSNCLVESVGIHADESSQIIESDSLISQRQYLDSEKSTTTTEEVVDKDYATEELIKELSKLRDSCENQEPSLDAQTYIQTPRRSTRQIAKLSLGTNEIDRIARVCRSSKKRNTSRKISPQKKVNKKGRQKIQENEDSNSTKEMDDSSIGAGEENEENNLTIVESKRKKKPMTFIDNWKEIPDEVVQTIIESGIDNFLAQKAEEQNLTCAHVKTIIKHIVKHEHVMEMLESQLNGLINPTALEPTLTRAKKKELYEKKMKESGEDLSTTSTTIPDAWINGVNDSYHSGCHPVHEIRSIVTTEFPEEEDDDEYHPEADEQILSDDESGVSGFGSPSTTITTPGSLTCTPNSTFSNTSRRMCTPVSSRSGLRMLSGTKSVQRNLDFNKSFEEKSLICSRTRSKYPMTDTPLEYLEMAFKPPDITADMYETECDNEDWKKFLQDYCQPQDNIEVQEDDEQVDPEYNLLADAEEEVKNADDLHEELRLDKAVRVSKKEYHELMADIFDSFSIEGNEKDTFVKDYNDKFKNSSFRNNDIQVINHSYQMDITNSQYTTNYPEYDKGVIPPSTNEGYVMQDNIVYNEPFYLNYAQPVEAEESPITITYMIHEFSHQQIEVLKCQLAQHAQQLTTSILITGYAENMEYIANGCHNMLNEMLTTGNQSVSAGSSLFHPFNLKDAIATACSYEEQRSQVADEVRKEKQPKTYPNKQTPRSISPHIAPLFVNSSAFPYTSLLPKGMFHVTEKQVMRRLYFPSEYMLIACCMQELMPNAKSFIESRAKGTKYINKYLRSICYKIASSNVVATTGAHLSNHVRYIHQRNAQDGLFSDNPVVVFLKTGIFDIPTAKVEPISRKVPCPLKLIDMKYLPPNFQKLVKNDADVPDNVEKIMQDHVDCNLHNTLSNAPLGSIIIIQNLQGTQIILPPNKFLQNFQPIQPNNKGMNPKEFNGDLRPKFPSFKIPQTRPVNAVAPIVNTNFGSTIQPASNSPVSSDSTCPTVGMTSSGTPGNLILRNSCGNVVTLGNSVCLNGGVVNNATSCPLPAGACYNYETFSTQNGTLVPPGNNYVSFIPVSEKVTQTNEPLTVCTNNVTTASDFPKQFSYILPSPHNGNLPSPNANSSNIPNPDMTTKVLLANNSQTPATSPAIVSHNIIPISNGTGVSQAIRKTVVISPFKGALPLGAYEIPPTPLLHMPLLMETPIKDLVLPDSGSKDISTTKIITVEGKQYIDVSNSTPKGVCTYVEKSTNASKTVLPSNSSELTSNLQISAIEYHHCSNKDPPYNNVMTSESVNLSSTSNKYMISPKSLITFATSDSVVESLPQDFSVNNDDDEENEINLSNSMVNNSESTESDLSSFSHSDDSPHKEVNITVKRNSWKMRLSNQRKLMELEKTSREQTMVNSQENLKNLKDPSYNCSTEPAKSITEDGENDQISFSWPDCEMRIAVPTSIFKGDKSGDLKEFGKDKNLSGVYGEVFINKVQKAFKGASSKSKFNRFMSLLCQFEDNSKTPEEIYFKISKVLNGFPDLQNQFVMFLTPDQARRVEKYEVYCLYHCIRDLTSILEKGNCEPAEVVEKLRMLKRCLPQLSEQDLLSEIMICLRPFPLYLKMFIQELQKASLEPSEIDTSEELNLSKSSGTCSRDETNDTFVNSSSTADNTIIHPPFKNCSPHGNKKSPQFIDDARPIENTRVTSSLNSLRNNSKLPTGNLEKNDNEDKRGNIKSQKETKTKLANKNTKYPIKNTKYLTKDTNCSTNVKTSLDSNPRKLRGHAIKMSNEVIKSSPKRSVKKTKNIKSQKERLSHQKIIQNMGNNSLEKEATKAGSRWAKEEDIIIINALREEVPLNICDKIASQIKTKTKEQVLQRLDLLLGMLQGIKK